MDIGKSTYERTAFSTNTHHKVELQYGGLHWFSCGKIHTAQLYKKIVWCRFSPVFNFPSGIFQRGTHQSSVLVLGWVHQIALNLIFRSECIYEGSHCSGRVPSSTKTYLDFACYALKKMKKTTLIIIMSHIVGLESTLLCNYQIHNIVQI